MVCKIACFYFGPCGLKREQGGETKEEKDMPRSAEAQRNIDLLLTDWALASKRRECSERRERQRAKAEKKQERNRLKKIGQWLDPTLEKLLCLFKKKQPMAPCEIRVLVRAQLIVLD